MMLTRKWQFQVTFPHFWSFVVRTDITTAKIAEWRKRTLVLGVKLNAVRHDTTDIPMHNLSNNQEKEERVKEEDEEEEDEAEEEGEERQKAWRRLNRVLILSKSVCSYAGRRGITLIRYLAN